MQFISLQQQPDIEPTMDGLIDGVWPSYYLNHSVGANLWRPYMMREFPDCQTAILNDAGEMVAVINCVPLHFDGTPEDLPDTGWDGLVDAGMRKYQQGVPANVLMALAVSIARNNKGQGLSYLGLRVMKAIAARRGFSSLYAPVRPNKKMDYPLIPIEDYMNWRREDGELFDPWLRVHNKLGASLVKACPRSMLIETTVENWEKETGLSFKQSGQYVLRDALCPIEIDREQNRGTYIEPNVWMHHRIAPDDGRLFEMNDE